MRDLDPVRIGITLLVIVLSLSVHEFAHAKFADMAGDPTPRDQGRVTLNPLAHLDPIGTIALIISSLAGVGIGWGRPVMVRPDKMRNPRWDHFTSVLAGPVSNLCLAILAAGAFRLLIPAGQIGGIFSTAGGPLAEFLLISVLVNVGLFAFNLIPIGPLDGHWLVGAFLPEPQRLGWYKFNRGAGMLLFLAIIFIRQPIDVLGTILLPVSRFFVRTLMGIG